MHFCGSYSEKIWGSTIAPPLSGACVSSVKIGKKVFVNSNLLAMARGGITVEDNVRVAANVQLISNNHDPYDLDNPAAFFRCPATALPQQQKCLQYIRHSAR